MNGDQCGMSAVTPPIVFSTRAANFDPATASIYFAKA
jgi:hypothetical protein